jgi:hypothetical protein
LGPAHAALVRPEQLPALAARDDGVRAALALTLKRYGACKLDTCLYALIARPNALCPGCPMPDGGAAVLLTAGTEGGLVELAVWSAFREFRESCAGAAG